MPRLFIPSVPDKEIRLTGKEARYILRVLRRRKGDELTLFDSKGNSYRAVITETGRKEATASIKETLHPKTESPLGLILLQAVLKGQKMDLVIRKTTELGVKEIIPVISERTEVRETGKLSRWRKIAVEAGQQSGRTVVPEIQNPVGLMDFFSSAMGQGAPAKLSPPLKGIILYEQDGISIRKAAEDLSAEGVNDPSTVFLLVGPEGGFTPEEAEAAVRVGLKKVYLGERTLRAETAAIAGAAVLQSLLGDMR
jgi:16S rRNA (uracil1498-N3)-methyltransferase